MLKRGDTAPDFQLPSTKGTEIKLSDFKGKYVILYFYPHDFTPLCTKQACLFRDNFEKISRNREVKILGINNNSIERHYEFKKVLSLPFDLLSDQELIVSKQYGAIMEDVDRGKQVVQRITFIIDPNGRVLNIYPKVRLNKHVEEITEVISQYSI